MTFAEFERHAQKALEEIPLEYLAGIDGLTVSRDAPEHPDFDGVWTLGECLTEEHVSDYASADTLRSAIVLYWGSFHELASRDSNFDWEGEIWETLTHELRHHLESLAGDDALEEVDRAAEESFRRAEGEPFDARYYQFGLETGPGSYSVEKAHFIERPITLEAFEALDAIDFDFRGVRYSIARPSELGDVHYMWVENLGEDGESVEVVLVRKHGWLRAARRLLGATEAIVLESSARAEPIGAAGVAVPMSLHDAWARITPLEMLFTSSDAAQAFLATVAEEAEGRGAMPDVPHSFVTMATTSDFISSVAGEGASDAEVQRVSALAYHVVNFHRLDGRLYFLDTAVSRYLTGGPPGATAPLPSRAGYAQLPQHLFWLEDGESAPESVDGLFWTVTVDGVLHSLVVTNVRTDGTGAGVVPLPEAPIGSSAEWLDIDARGDGADFTTSLPGGDLDQLYGLSSSGEVLKLLARFFAYLHAVPDAAAAGSVPADAETPRPTALPHFLVRLRA